MFEKRDGNAPAVPNGDLIAKSGGHPVVLFDGVCNLCSGWARFAMARDSSRLLRFATMQSDTGQEFLRGRALPTDRFETFYLIDGGRVYEKSEAFLQMVKYLRRPWPALAAARLLPRALRDWVYDRIAKNRYRLFGRRATCMIPDGNTADRFL